MMMFKTCPRVTALAALAVAVTACARTATPMPTLVLSTPVATARSIPGAGTVTASGVVAPAQEANLSLPRDEVVAEVLVAEGDQVEMGQLLVRLEANRQVGAVAEAEARLRYAQVQLDRLRAGPSTQEMAAAQAAVEEAQAGLAKLEENAQPEDMAAAQAALASAKAALQKALEGPDQDEITIAVAALRRSEISLQQVQWAYDQVAYAADVGTSPEAAQLEQASLDYQTALADYHLAVRGPTQAEVAAAQAQLAQAEASLARLERGASQADLAAAQAGIRRAQAQLELLEAGARPEDIAAAEAEVAAAQAALTQAQAALADTELYAPMAGTIASVGVSPGEVMPPLGGQPALILADLDHLQVETTDLSERDVARVAVGQPAIVYVEGLGQEIQGRVVRIASQATTLGGDVVYKVVIELAQQPSGLRWGMSVDVDVEVTSP
ncbi:MAG: HlyD family efflux transporter periplasmic adaptor subunit [Anaerolineales bacterium]|nr:MAG: HlyD family efflux transporter periplasmic adaptor subunit [Anaerolineales bacterium]